MKTMGITQLYLVNPKKKPDATSHAMASGATDVLDACVITNCLADALAGATLAVGVTARRRDLSPELKPLRDAAPMLGQHAHSQGLALVFGTEMSGLTNEEIGSCQALVTIPANPAYSSLNLAAAVQIVTYELRLACIDTPIFASDLPPLAPIEDIERFFDHLERALIHLKFLDPAQPKRLMLRLRRLFARTRLEQEEVNILRGILSRIIKVD